MYLAMRASISATSLFSRRRYHEPELVRTLHAQNQSVKQARRLYRILTTTACCLARQVGVSLAGYALACSAIYDGRLHLVWLCLHKQRNESVSLVRLDLLLVLVQRHSICTTASAPELPFRRDGHTLHVSAGCDICTSTTASATGSALMANPASFIAAAYTKTLGVQLSFSIQISLLCSGASRGGLGRTCRSISAALGRCMQEQGGALTLVTQHEAGQNPTASEPAVNQHVSTARSRSAYSSLQPINRSAVLSVGRLRAEAAPHTRATAATTYRTLRMTAGTSPPPHTTSIDCQRLLVVPHVGQVRVIGLWAPKSRRSDSRPAVPVVLLGDAGRRRPPWCAWCPAPWGLNGDLLEGPVSASSAGPDARGRCHCSTANWGG